MILFQASLQYRSRATLKPVGKVSFWEAGLGKLQRAAELLELLERGSRASVYIYFMIGRLSLALHFFIFNLAVPKTVTLIITDFFLFFFPPKKLHLKAALPRSIDMAEEAEAVMSPTHFGSVFSGNESWKRVKWADGLGNCLHPLPMQKRSLQHILLFYPA